MCVSDRLSIKCPGNRYVPGNGNGKVLTLLKMCKNVEIILLNVDIRILRCLFGLDALLW